MRYLFLALIIFSTSLAVCGQVLKNDKHDKFNYTKKSFGSNKSNSDYLLEKQILENRLDDASKTIEYLNSIVNSFGQIFTVLGIFIGVIALALPVVMYQFGIKPSQRALKELELNIDSRLEKYLKNARDKEIDNAIANIDAGSDEKKNQAISYLTLTNHEGLTDQQLFKIYSILNKNRSQTNIKSQLAFILSATKNEFAEALFTKDEMTTDPIINQMGYLYFIKTGFENHRTTISNVITSAGNSLQEFNTFIINLAQYSSEYVIALFNDQELIDSINSILTTEMKDSLPHILDSVNISDEVFKGTYLFSKLENI